MNRQNGFSDGIALSAYFEAITSDGYSQVKCTSPFSHQTIASQPNVVVGKFGHYVFSIVPV
jgi:hypothetical protein